MFTHRSGKSPNQAPTQGNRKGFASKSASPFSRPDAPGSTPKPQPGPEFPDAPGSTPKPNLPDAPGSTPKPQPELEFPDAPGSTPKPELPDASGSTPKPPSDEPDASGSPPVSSSSSPKEWSFGNTAEAQAQALSSEESSEASGEEMPGPAGGFDQEPQAPTRKRKPARTQSQPKKRAKLDKAGNYEAKVPRPKLYNVTAKRPNFIINILDDWEKTKNRLKEFLPTVPKDVDINLIFEAESKDVKAHAIPNLFTEWFTFTRIEFLYKEFPDPRKLPFINQITLIWPLADTKPIEPILTLAKNDRFLKFNFLTIGLMDAIWNGHYEGKYHGFKPGRDVGLNLSNVQVISSTQAKEPVPVLAPIPLPPAQAQQSGEVKGDPMDIEDSGLAPAPAPSSSSSGQPFGRDAKKLVNYYEGPDQDEQDVEMSSPGDEKDSSGPQTSSGLSSSSSSSSSSAASAGPAIPGPRQDADGDVDMGHGELKKPRKKSSRSKSLNAREKPISPSKLPEPAFVVYEREGKQFEQLVLINIAPNAKFDGIKKNFWAGFEVVHESNTGLVHGIPGVLLVKTTNPLVGSIAVIRCIDNNGKVMGGKEGRELAQRASEVTAEYYSLVNIDVSSDQFPRITSEDSRHAVLLAIINDPLDKIGNGQLLTSNRGPVTFKQLDELEESIARGAQSLLDKITKQYGVRVKLPLPGAAPGSSSSSSSSSGSSSVSPGSSSGMYPSGHIPAATVPQPVPLTKAVPALSAPPQNPGQNRSALFGGSLPPVPVFSPTSAASSSSSSGALGPSRGLAPSSSSAAASPPPIQPKASDAEQATAATPVSMDLS